jgi:transposase
MTKKSPPAFPTFPVREFFARFPDEAACLGHIMTVRFGGVAMDCPSCGVEGEFHKLRDRRVFACPHCLHQIAPTANTILHDTRTPLVSWFYAMYLYSTTRHGVSGKELQRQLGVTYKTAYRIGMQIRKLMGAADFDGLLAGHIQADEAYVGGRRSGGKRGRGAPGNRHGHDGRGRHPRYPDYPGREEANPSRRCERERREGFGRLDRRTYDLRLTHWGRLRSWRCEACRQGVNAL